MFVRCDLSERAMDGALGFAAGVMPAASFTSLIIPGIENYSDGSPLPVLFGAAFLDHSDIFVPHAHYLLCGRQRADAADPSDELPVNDERLAGVVLYVLAITPPLHARGAGRRRRLR